MHVGIATDHGGGLKDDRSRRHRLGERDDEVRIIVERGVAICGSGVGVSVCANKIPGVRAVQTFLTAEFSDALRHLRRLSKVASLELQPMRTNR
jgi:Ribose/Galactose Isomerase